MIPLFPRLKTLEISDKHDVERFTKPFPPYSDFNFVSLWVWNTEENVEISRLNNNLVIKFQDYITSDYFYSFIGNNNIVNTIKTIMTFAKEKNLEKRLKLIPANNFDDESLQTAHKMFDIVEDRDNYDSILDVKKIAYMEGGKLHHKRKMLNRFLKKYKYKIDAHVLSQADEKKIIDFFFLWEKTRSKNRNETQNELNAMHRLFINPEILKLTIIYAINNNDLIGYTIFEIINKEYAVSDFQKADLRFEGASELLNFTMAKYLHEKGCKYINIEQDLGIPGLRRSKLDYNPSFLKKYLIKEK